MIMGVDDLFTEKRVQIDELVNNPDEQPDVYRYVCGEEFRAWHKDNALSGRSHVICVAIEFLHKHPDYAILDEAYSRLSEYLNIQPDKFSNIAVSDIIVNNDNTETVLFDISCNFQNENVELFLDTLATIYGILIYIHDNHNTNDPVWFNKYQIAYMNYNDDPNKTTIHKIPIKKHPFEELIYQLKSTIKTYERDFVNKIAEGLEYTQFFDAHKTDLWRRVISWTYKQQQRKLKLPLYIKVNEISKERINRARVLSVSRFDLM